MFPTAKTWRGGLPAAVVRLRGELNPWLSDGDRQAIGASQAPLCVWEEEQHLLVEVEMPGVAREDLDLTFEQGRLHISGTRKPHDPQVKYLHNERHFGPVQRVLVLPEQIDPETIEAQFENGLLRLTLTKKPEVLPKRIEVRTE